MATTTKSDSKITTLDDQAPAAAAPGVAVSAAKSSGQDSSLSGKKVLLTIHASDGEYGHEAVNIGHNNVVYQIPRNQAWEVPVEVANIIAQAVVTTYKRDPKGGDIELNTPRFAHVITPVAKSAAA